MPQLTIQQWPQDIHVGRNQKILDAALSAGAPMPFNCRSGECGECKCRLVSGQVDHAEHSPDALSPQERASGLILACRSRPASEHIVLSVSALNSSGADANAPPLQAPQRQMARVLAREAANHDVMRLRLAFSGAAPAFVAGQFSRLAFDGVPARSYSMANQPGDDTWEFHIRRVPGGHVSGHVFNQLLVGDTIEVQGPYGSACWSQPTPAPLLLVAGGTGLAPILSILRAALAAGQSIEALYHGVRAEQDLYSHDLLRQMADGHRFRLIPVFSAGGSAPSIGRAGFVHQALGQDFASLRGYRIFVCGPPPMVEASKALALARGADPQHVLADAFYAEPADAADSEVSKLSEVSPSNRSQPDYKAERAANDAIPKAQPIWRRLRNALR